MKIILNDYKNYLSLDRQFSQNTVSAYLRDVRQFLDFCEENNTKYSAASPGFLDEYIYYLKESEGLSPRSVFRKTEAVKNFYKYLLINNILKEDPCRFLSSPRLSAKIPDQLSEEEMSRLLSFPPSNFTELRTVTILELFYATGLRVSELTGLSLENVSIKDRWILVQGKGSKQRVVPIHEKACERLGKYLAEREVFFAAKNTDSEVFLSKTGKKISRVNVWKDISELGRLAGISKPLYPHLLRHTFASHILKGGADLRSVQEMLGHENLDTTQIYTHLNITDIKNKHKKFHPRG
ncbi:integrase/recombinase XerD [Parelusimicrobium proximum]|uniref:site-specific tyrosine recombinase/integron integrase n=1 Tax=Parelusimicrobium proximum TaxID=3228953 RepID=UPI003D1717C6